MRTFLRSLVILIALGSLSQPLSAQTVDLNDTRTAEQMWDRALTFSNFGFTGMIALAKEADMTAEEVGEFFWRVGHSVVGSSGRHVSHRVRVVVSSELQCLPGLGV